MNTPEEQEQIDRMADNMVWFFQAILFSVAAIILIGYALRGTGLTPDADWKTGTAVYLAVLITTHGIKWFDKGWRKE